MNRRLLGWTGIAAIALTVVLLLSNGWHQGIKASSADTLQIAQESTEAVPTLTDVSGLTLSGTYEDPQGSFQVGILEGFSVSSVGGSPLFQNDTGSLAYSLVRVPLNTEAPLPDIGLVEVTRQALNNGEGFQTQAFSSVPGGGLQIAWTGRLSQGSAPPQPLSGVILAKQQGAEVYLLVVAALEDAVPQVPQVVSLLSDSLTIL